eukprot:scaffold37386_cov82-Phaeocystis_antarctica.AAC.1
MLRSSAPLHSSSSPPSGRAGTLNGATCWPLGGEGWWLVFGITGARRPHLSTAYSPFLDC